MVFGGLITFSTPPKYFAAALTKNRLFRRASKEQRPKSCVLGSTTIRASGGENCPSRFERVPGFSWNPSGGSTKASKEASVMMSPRWHREDVAVPSRRRLPAETPRGLGEVFTEQSRRPFETSLAECSRSLREGFVKPSRCLHQAFTE